MGRKDRNKESCFICGGDSSLKPVKENQLNKYPLKNSLKVIFVLRNLLEVPREQIVNKLEEEGDNPDRWISFCDKCINRINNARELEEEINIYENELRNDEKKIVGTIRTSGDDDKGREKAYLGNLFRDKIRAYFKQDSFVKKLKNAEVESPPFGTEEPPLPTKCFFCDCIVVTTITAENIPFGDDESDKMENNLDVIFVLKMVLKVPNIYLRKQYEDCGPNPEKWIKFCDHCARLARTARKLDEDIRKIKKPLRSLQKQVIEKIKKSHKNGDRSLLSFENKISAFVKSYNYAVHWNDDLNPEEFLVYLKNPTESKRVQDNRPSTEINKIRWTPKKTRITEDNKFECGGCGKIYRKAKFWSEHQWKRHKMKEFPCPIEDCGLICTSKNGSDSDFQVHWKMVHKKKKEPETTTAAAGIGPWICNICSVEKCTKQRLGYHRKMVHGVGLHGKPLKAREGPWICEICGVAKNRKQNLAAHRRRVHKIGLIRQTVKLVEMGSLVCSYCGKGFSSESNRYTHVRFVHEKRFSLSCHVCGIGVMSSHSLKKHLLARHKEDPETKRLVEEEGLKLCRCKVARCKIKFLSEEALNKHVEKMHGGDRDRKEVRSPRFQCTVCGKSFWAKYKLVRHEKIHDNNRERSWKCEECGGEFWTKDNLRNHRNKVHRKKIN